VLARNKRPEVNVQNPGAEAAANIMSVLLRFLVQGSVLGPVLFNGFYKRTGCRNRIYLTKFANTTKLGGAADYLKYREALQRDLDRQESWAIMNHMK